MANSVQVSSTQRMRVYGQQENTMLKLNKQRKDGDLCDVILEAEERQFPIHRAVLSTSCSYFETMLDKSKFIEGNKEVIPLKGVRADILEIVLNGIYKGELEFEIKDMLDLAALCDCYNLPEFMNQIHKAALLILNHEQDSIRYSYLFNIRALASLHNWEDVRLRSEKGIKENMLTICLLNNWESTPYKEILGCVKREDICAKDEDCFIDAVLKWIKSNPIGRAKYTEELMENVRFPLLSPAKMSSLQKESIMQESKKCMEWLREATHFWLETNNGQVLRQKSENSTSVNADGIKYRPRQTLNDTVIYALLNSTDLRAYYPKYNSWYSLSALDEPQYPYDVIISNASASIIYALHCTLAENDDDRCVMLQMYSSLENTWNHCRPPAENLKRIVNCNGKLVGFTKLGAIACYNPDNDSWNTSNVQINGDLDVNIILEENYGIWPTSCGNVLIDYNQICYKLDPIAGTIVQLEEVYVGDDSSFKLSNNVEFVGIVGSHGLAMSVSNETCFVCKTFVIPDGDKLPSTLINNETNFIVDQKEKKLYVLGKPNDDEVNCTNECPISPLVVMSYTLDDVTKPMFLTSLLLPKTELEEFNVACIISVGNAFD